jgi:hypothetical protein
MGMLPRRISRGRHRLDLAEQGSHDIDGPGENLPRQVPPLLIYGRLVSEGAEGPNVLALHRPAQRLDTWMQAEREVGHQHGARLRAAQRDLVIGLGVGPGGMQADRRQPHRGHPPKRLGAEFRLPADDDRLHPRSRQRIVQVTRLRHVGPFLEAGERRPEPVLGVLANPTGPGSFLGPASQDQEVHDAAHAAGTVRLIYPSHLIISAPSPVDTGGHARGETPRRGRRADSGILQT